MLRILFYVSLLAFPLATQAAENDGRTPQNTQSDFDAVTRYERALTLLLGTHDVEKSETKAAEIFIELAEQGSTAAQHMLGRLYEQGKGVEQSDDAALQWYTRAADQGFAPSQRKVKNIQHQRQREALATAEDL